jgi:tetratricopeptide (TPR) repeat protein
MKIFLSKYRYFFNIAFFLILLIWISSKSIAAFRYLQEGMQAPIIEGIDSNTGDKISSDNWKNDGITIIVFWATWSKRSVDELVDLAELSVRYQDKPLHIIAVNVEGPVISNQMKEKITEKINSLNLPFAAIFDDGLISFNEFGVIAIPSTAIIDSSGLLRYAPAGYSYSIQDKIIDSIEVLLGIKKHDVDEIIKAGYTPTLKASRYYGLAIRMLNNRMYESALEKLILSIEADSLFAAPYTLRGQINLMINSPKEAVEAFKKAIELDSNSVTAWAGYGRANLEVGDSVAAVESLTKALSLEDTYAPALLDFAITLSNEGKRSEALDSLEKARELNPKDHMVHYYLGRVYQSDNQIGKAALSYQESLELLFSSE